MTCGCRVWWAGLSSAAVALSLVVGCGQSGTAVGQLSGIVTIGGKPASGATVRFFDDANQLVGGATVNDAGEYVVTGLPYKQLRVAVEGGQAAGIYASAAPPPGTTPISGTGSIAPAKIPSKYQAAESSGLSATVSRSEATMNFTLE